MRCGDRVSFLLFLILGCRVACRDDDDDTTGMCKYRVNSNVITTDHNFNFSFEEGVNNFQAFACNMNIRRPAPFTSFKIYVKDVTVGWVGVHHTFNMKSIACITRLPFPLFTFHMAHGARLRSRRMEIYRFLFARLFEAG